MSAFCPDTTQSKTKAKQRYLKAKKDRRKKRKVLSATSTGGGEARDVTKNQPVSGSDESGSEDEAAEDQEGVVSEGDVVAVTPKPAKRTRKDEDRSKKRRKFDHEEAIEVRAEPEGIEEDEEVEPLSTHASPSRAKSPTPPAALQAFPQPRRPEAPSKSVLALQGLNRALIEADIVNPATTLDIEPSLDAPDEKTGLSGKVRRRLQDLGITELFAGLSLSPVLYIFLLCLHAIFISADCGCAFTTFENTIQVVIQPL